MDGYEKALKSFLEDKEEFADAVLESGVLADHGGYLNLALFADGTWERRNQLAWKKSGRVIGIPHLSDEDYVKLCQQAGGSSREKLVKELASDNWVLEGPWILSCIQDTMKEALENYGEQKGE